MAEDRDSCADLDPQHFTWMCDYLDGCISASDLHELERLLASDAEARRHFRNLATTEEGLADLGARPPQFGDNELTSSEAMSPSLLGAVFSSRSMLLASCLVLAFVVLGCLWIYTQPNRAWQVAVDPDGAEILPVEQIHDDSMEADREQSSLSRSNTVLALLTELTGTRRLDLQTPVVTVLSRGASLSKGKFILQRGMCQLEFLSGANVVIEGPAEFELVSEMKLICNRGRLRAMVPEQAKGFTVVTPEVDCVDLGTEFAIEVGDTGESEVHVLQGEVELRGHTERTPHRLKEGEAAQLGVDLKSIAIDQGGFRGLEWMASRANGRDIRRMTLWRDHWLGLQQDEDLLIFFDFNASTPWQRTLTAHSTERSDGAIVGCAWSEGRWRGKTALEFKRISDCVRIDVPGEFETLTYSAWVRIEGVSNWLSSLVLTDGYDPGECHWQLSDKGEINVGNSGGDPDYTLSPPTIGPSDLGRWVHFASVVDGKNSTLTHYVDGGQVFQTSVNFSLPLRIGKAEIGNWKPEGLDYPIRALNGLMDELAIFKRPLTATEIAKIYEVGRP